MCFFIHFSIKLIIDSLLLEAYPVEISLRKSVQTLPPVLKAGCTARLFLLKILWSIFKPFRAGQRPQKFVFFEEKKGKMFKNKT